MILVHDTFPDVHETDYRVLANRAEGEKALVSIAAKSSREFICTYVEE